MPDGKLDILAQGSPRTSPAHAYAVALVLGVAAALGIVTAFGVAPGSTLGSQAQVVVLETPETPAFEPLALTEAPFVALDRVQRGDTVAALLDRLGIRDAQAADFLRNDPMARSLHRRLVPGRTIIGEVGREGALRRLRYSYGPDGFLEIERVPSGFTAREQRFSDPPRVFHRSGTIRSSLFAATDAAGIPDAIALQIARVFSTDIDFHVDLRRGDRFSVVYEVQFASGEPASPGRILAAEFTNSGRTYHAVLFRDEEGRDSHYALDGSNRAKAFLRSPVEFSRVSSGFGARFHPIFRNWRAHTGVDFAAPQGTRVLAAADGTVTAVGNRSGYGNTVEIRHGGGISTLYAHLSRFAAGIRSGARVRQGEAIGFVGATGWATGPHLHYEFKVSGIHQNPMKVALPKATPVPPSLRPQFELAARRARVELAFAGATVPSHFE